MRPLDVPTVGQPEATTIPTSAEPAGTIPATSVGLTNLVVKIVELCNLNCRYCYLYNQGDTTFRGRPKFMSSEIFAAMVSRVAEYCDARPGHRIGLTLHGGEPTLIGPERFGQLASLARDVLGPRLQSLQMQTNGTQLDQRWVTTLRACGVHASVSLDGPAELHNQERVDHAGRGSYDGTVRGLRLLQQAGMAPGVLAVVAPGQDGAEVYRHLRHLGLTSIDFLLPDITWDSKDEWYGHLGPTPVADYLIPAFDAWFDEDDPQVSVRIFTGLLRRMLGGDLASDAFGNPVQGYLIVETDGSIQPLDALRICSDGITDSAANVLSHGFDDLAATAPLAHRLTHEPMPLSETCLACPELAVCGGGYLPHRYSAQRQFDNPSAWCADILRLLAHLRDRSGIAPSPPTRARQDPV